MISVEDKVNYFISLVPRTDEIDATWENSSFEDAEEESQNSKSALQISAGHNGTYPMMDKAHTNNEQAPGND
jgi:hypothetical protein